MSHTSNIFCLVTSLPTKVKIHGTYYIIFYSLLFPVTSVQIELLISKGIVMGGGGGRGVAVIGSKSGGGGFNIKIQFYDKKNIKK